MSGVRRSLRAVVTGLAVASLAIGVTAFAGTRPPVDLAPDVVVARPIPPPGEQSVTALAISVATPPRVMPGSDGHTHIAYDLLSTNATPVAITLTGVEVTTVDGRPLASLSGAALLAATHPVGAMGTPSATVPSSATFATMVDVTLPEGVAPKQVTHQITYDLPADVPAAFRALLGTPREVRGPQVPVDAGPAVAIAAPVTGPNWVSLNGCCGVPTAQHRLSLLPANGQWKKPELFAVDWVTTKDGRLCTGACTAPGEFASFGASLLAVGNGVVVRAGDGRPDNPSTTPPPPTSAADFFGNFVVVELRPGVYAFYGHLQQGSVAVAVGERVKTGQQVGRLGNSGNSFGPHLHFSVLDNPDYFQAASLAFVIDRFTLTGTAVIVDSGAVTVTGPARDVRRVHPMVNSVAEFG